MALSIITGLRPSTILWRHILPNVLPSVIVLASQSFGQAIIYEASLSYLGLAVQPPGVSWGLMIAQARIFLSSQAWLVLAPALALAVTALAANVLGDLVRDRLDPTLEAARQRCGGDLFSTVAHRPLPCRAAALRAVDGVSLDVRGGLTRDNGESGGKASGAGPPRSDATAVVSGSVMMDGITAAGPGPHLTRVRSVAGLILRIPPPR